MAVKLANFLGWLPGTPEREEPVVTMVFTLQDGRTIVVAANDKTLHKNGKAFRLKGEHGEIFLNLAEGVFFFGEAAEQDGTEKRPFR